MVFGFRTESRSPSTGFPTQNCNKITIDKSLALPLYIASSLQIGAAREQLKQRTTDTARPFLSLTNLKETLVSVPPLPEQFEIVRRVSALFRLADAIEKRVSATIARTDRLTQSILVKAFCGELVPNEAELARREGREYEPASVLLERIKAQRMLNEADNGRNGRSTRQRRRRS
jgi:type I restriction enzyme S subunit